MLNGGTGKEKWACNVGGRVGKLRAIQEQLHPISPVFGGITGRDLAFT